MSREVSIQSMGQRQRLFEWSQRVADCRQSGMSVKRWCEENYSWQKKVFSFMVEQQKLQLEAEDQESCFVELPPPQQLRQAASELVANIQVGQTSVNIYSGADSKMVQALLLALKSC